MRKKITTLFLTIIVIGSLTPQNLTMPVQSATASDYNKDSFWYYPWGKSITHKGVDIFAKKGTPIHASTKGFVIYSGNMKKGGNVVIILGPKWRRHLYSHLEEIKTSTFPMSTKTL